MPSISGIVCWFLLMLLFWRFEGRVKKKRRSEILERGRDVELNSTIVRVLCY